jgi:putative SOS response-associated peptidase YedK
MLVGSVDAMCGRFTSRTPASDLAEYFGVDEVVAPELGARYNVAPTDETYAVAESGEERRLGTFRWGLVPFWAKDVKIGSRMINARAEGLLDTSAFRRPFERRRCIVPADGFYEWEHTGGTRKQPWYITRADGKPMALAGLWDSWRPVKGSDEGKVRSCVIITGEPNATIARLHDRMPVLLPPEVWDLWLDPTNDDVASLQSLLVPAPDELFELVPVSTAVNTVTNDGPELVEPVAPGEGTLFS